MSKFEDVKMLMNKRFTAGGGMGNARVDIWKDEWKTIQDHIASLEKRVSDYGWEASARHAAMTGGTL